MKKEFYVFNLILLLTVQFLNGQKSVKIGNQTWMAENLAVTQFNNGDPILQIESPIEWVSAGENQKSAWSYYDNDIQYKSHRSSSGILYNHYTVVDPRGLCPKGWRMPTKADWKELVDFIGGDEKYHWLKSKNWNNSCKYCTFPGTDSYGFNALPGGYRTRDGYFKGLGEFGRWWSSDENFFHMQSQLYDYYYESAYGKENSFPVSAGMSVRCIKE